MNAQLTALDAWLDQMAAQRIEVRRLYLPEDVISHVMRDPRMSCDADDYIRYRGIPVFERRDHRV